MNPHIPLKQFRFPEETDSKESYKNWQEKNKLTLRKNHIFNTLFSKRKSLMLEKEIQKSKYYINIKEISSNEDIINNPELYIKTKFDIKHWFKYFFSSNINQIKEAIYIIELFIRMQIKEIDIEKRVLSRNDTELINGFCDYLFHQDKQIAFYACSCLTNLTFFPNHIEKRIYTQRNLHKIIEFFKNNDFNFGHQIILLLINCSTYNETRKYFIDHGIFERLIFLINTNLEQLEPKYYIYIIRLLCNITKIFNETDEYNKEQIKCWSLPLLPFVKNTTKNSFVRNPWAIYDDCRFYIEIIRFYTTIDVKSKEFLLEIIKDEFYKILIELYYKINDDEQKIILLKIYADLLSNDDSINEYFIEEGILGLFLNEINKIEFKNLDMLDNILFACSNIACGSVGQIEQLYMQGLIWKCFDIIQFFSKQKISILIKKIIYNSFYTIIQAINGGNNELKIEIMLYQDYEIINIIAYVIKNILDINNENLLLECIGSSIYELIKRGESDLDEESLKNFKNKLIMNGMEEIIDDIIFNHKINENLIKLFNFIKLFLKE